jgi:outer membrane protein assembly factor BamB
MGACSWSTFGFGPDHTRTDPTSAAFNTSNVSTLTLKGSGATGGGVDSSPAVANGVVYVGSDDNKLYAFPQLGGPPNCAGSPQTCTPLWTAVTGDNVASSPAVANGVVYVGSNDHKLYAFDAAGGSATCTGTPVVCTPLWTATTGDAVQSSPALANGVVYVGSNDGKLYAFDAAGGAATCTGTPVVCTPLWTAAATDAIASSPAVVDNVVYVGSNDGKLYALDAAGGAATCTGTPKTCTPLWVGATGGAVFSSPAVSNDRVYVGSADKKLYAFDATPERARCTGTTPVCSPVWTAATGSVIFSSPGVQNGVVFVGSADGKLYAFDGAGGPASCTGSPRTCTPLWSGPTGNAVFSSPVPAGGGLLVGSLDGKLYAFGT